MDRAVTLFDRHSSALAVLGLSTAAIASWRTASFLWTYLRPSSLSRYQHGKPGSTWALVTGSTDGIGYAFVEALLERGFNVLMHGRNKAKLDGLVATLQAKHPNMQIRSVVADASDPNADIAGIAAVAESLPGPLTVLVNNVGGVAFSPLFRSIGSYTSEDADLVLNVNVRFSMQITRAITPLLFRSGPGLIINISSIATLFGMPSLAVYSGSKAFNKLFSRAVSREAVALGADLESLAVIVGNTQSTGNPMDVPIFTCSSKTCANGALDRVGCGRQVVYAWWRHDIQMAIMKSLPDWMITRLFKGHLASLDNSLCDLEKERGALGISPKQKTT